MQSRITGTTLLRERDAGRKQELWVRCYVSRSSSSGTEFVGGKRHRKKLFRSAPSSSGHIATHFSQPFLPSLLRKRSFRAVCGLPGIYYLFTRKPQCSRFTNKTPIPK